MYVHHSSSAVLPQGLCQNRRAQASEMAMAFRRDDMEVGVHKDGQKGPSARP